MNQTQRHGLPHSSDVEDLVAEHLEPIKAKFREYADPKCKTCFGRGYTGRIKDSLFLVPCPKCIDLRKMNEDNKKKQEEKATNQTDNEELPLAQVASEKDA